MKVFIVNKSAHNFEEAKKFGELIFMTEGRMHRYATNDMCRIFQEVLEDSHKEDHILLCSLNVMNAIACSVFAHKHGTLNLLLYNEGTYIERNHVF